MVNIESVPEMQASAYQCGEGHTDKEHISTSMRFVQLDMVSMKYEVFVNMWHFDKQGHCPEWGTLSEMLAEHGSDRETKTAKPDE
jgi:hypothetical protein